MDNKTDYIWKDRKRTIFGLPLSFTKYCLTEEKLIISTGFFNTREEEIRLYRIMDVTLIKSLGEKIFKVGSLHICSADKSTPEFTIQKIKRPNHMRDLISDMVETERKKKRVYGRESMHTDENDMDFDDGGHI